LRLCKEDHSSPEISVITPTLGESGLLDQIRKQVLRSSCVKEWILVFPPESVQEKEPPKGIEKHFWAEKAGRGYAFLKGIQQAQAEVLLLLHDDTLLPEHWDHLILDALSDPAVSGGAFHMKFEPEPASLGFLRKLGNQFTRLTHEFWGDHALFLRREILLKKPEVLEVPLMEDVRLSRWMRRSGKTVLLKSFVRTDPVRFLENGILRQSLINVGIRIAFGFGVSPERLYRWYYRKWKKRRTQAED
jgi:glycosyltransferase involved in cell wall biosynthesis